MTLSERFHEIVRAGFAGVYVVTHEPDEAIASLAKQANQHSWAFAVWDVDAGLQCSGSPATAIDPLSAVRAAAAMAKPEQTAVLVLRNFHRFLARRRRRPGRRAATRPRQSRRSRPRRPRSDRSTPGRTGTLVPRPRPRTAFARGTPRDRRRARQPRRASSPAKRWTDSSRRRRA